MWTYLAYRATLLLGRAVESASSNRAGESKISTETQTTRRETPIRLKINGYKIEPYKNLSGAHLSGANLTRARLEGANLSGAHLEGANLSWVILNGANLSEAHLEGANLTGAHLEGANLEGANLTNATMPDGSEHL